MGVIEKCTFCNHRILENKQPACVNLCPTGALGFEEKFPGVDNSKIFGFIEKEIKPSIRIIKLREKESLPQEVLDALPKYTFDPKLINKSAISPKLSFTKDWTLALFTLLAGVLFGLYAAAFWGNVQLNKWIFPMAGVAGMLLSTMHLGKKFRAWRAVSNVLNSWLSREIFFFSLFWFASAAWLWFENLYVGQVAILSGFLALVSIDMVYTVSEKTTPSRLHSAHTVLTGFFMAGVLLENEYLWGFTGAIKLMLYVYRKLYLRKRLTSINLLFSTLRLTFMLVLPMVIWHFLHTQGFNLILISLVLGELIDRADFYNELNIITPKSYLLEKEQLN
ncbi:MAG TPA: hypothetical protein DCQ31_15325 [Bacteroidales bacterium]|nr:hypothetical protein [Bacteroidales bacterium]